MSIEPFTAEHAEAAPGDEWLRQWRRERLAEAMAREMPSDEAEEWRYSRIGSYPEGDFVPVGAQGTVTSSQTPAPLPGPVADVLSRTGDHCGHVVTIDGVVAAQMGCAEADAAGVRFGPALDAALLGSVMTEPPDYFSAWNGALSAAPVVLDVPAGVELETPFVVVHHAELGRFCGLSAAGRSTPVRTAGCRCSRCSSPTTCEL